MQAVSVREIVQGDVETCRGNMINACMILLWLVMCQQDSRLFFMLFLNLCKSIPE